jgi:protein O-mannosyl-transferase
MKLVPIIKTDRDKFLACIFLVTLFTALTLYPCLNNGFINWDDDAYVYNNPNIHNLSYANIKTFFTSFYFSNYGPLTLLSYAVDYRVSQLKPRTYHTTNLVLHLLNCILVFWLIHLFSKNISIAFIVSLLFGIHPLHVESVAWISERKDVLYSFFFLSSLISYTKYLDKKKGAYWALSLFLFVLSCLSKSMAITLPFVLFLIDYLLHQKMGNKTLLLKIPFILISVVFAIITLLTQYGSQYSRPDNLFSFFGNFLRASYGLLFYLYKIILPVHLSGFYPIPQNIAGTYPITLLVSPFIIVLLALLIIIKFRHNRIAVFGTVFFLITIMPVLQFLPVGWAIAADRYTYIPALGIFYIFGEFCFWLHTQKLFGRKYLKVAFVSFLALVFVILSVLSWQRCHVWKDSITFWNDVISKYPNAPLAYNNRGNAYSMNGDDKRAIEDYKTAVRLDPGYLAGLDNLFRTYCKLGMNNVAIYLYDTITRQNPFIEKGLMIRGKAYIENKEPNSAINLYTALLIVLPQKAHTYLDGEIYNNLAMAHRLRKDFELTEYYARKAKNIGYNISRELEAYLKPGE